jgi:hypothetical protein
MKVICTRCGGTNIACEAIVNPNTGKIIDYLDESFMHANCGDCKEEVVITDVDRVKKDIDSMFFKFVKKNGKEPEYVECQIVWKDTGDDQRKTIKLSLSINDDDNDKVDGVDVYYDQISEVVYLAKVILEEMEEKIMGKAVKTDMEYREILEKSLSAIQYLRIHGFSTYMESEGIVNRIMMFKDKNEMRDQKIINIK